MTTQWAHLPNDQHIDKILKHLKTNPERWSAAWDAARDVAWDAARGAAWSAARGAARGAAWSAARDVAWDAARGAAWSAARDAARGAARGTARGAARDVAWGALLALIAYDDCAYILSLPSGAVRLMCSIDDGKAVLLYPAVLAMAAG